MVTETTDDDGSTEYEYEHIDPPVPPVAEADPYWVDETFLAEGRYDY